MESCINDLHRNIDYITPEGERKTMTISDEVADILRIDPKRRYEFASVFQAMREYEKNRRGSVADDSELDVQAHFFGKYYYQVKKLLTLNTRYEDTKYILQLLYGTERYKFLTQEDMRYLIDTYLEPMLQFSYRKNIPNFITRFKELVEAQNTSFEHSYMRLSDVPIALEHLFSNDGEDADVQSLLAAMADRERILHKGNNLSPSDLWEGQVAEFTVRMLTQTNFFTYDYHKAKGKVNPLLAKFYVGPDRQDLIGIGDID